MSIGSDAEAYRPVNARNLKDALLICHGMANDRETAQAGADGPVEVQHSPVEDHGFVQPISWADEPADIGAV